jgi:glycosyltransferase involved in cell wall biosynthesis
MNWVHRKTRTGLRHFFRAEINNWILSTIRGMADGIIYQSEFSQNWWNRVYGETSSVNRVIYNGVDLEQFSPNGLEKPPADHIRVLMVEGHLGSGYEQGLESAVQMVALLSQRLEQKVELMVVGSVPDSLQKNFQNRDIKIEWRGVVKRTEIPSIDRSAHLLFSSDINAACPNSVIEALACGLPVIGYDTGALPELIEGDAGAVARYGGDVWKLEKPDIHTLADAAQQVISDPQKNRLAARARAVELFDIKKIADQYLEMLT